MKAISLFCSGGIGDLALQNSGFDVIVANEKINDRAQVFKFNYPETSIIIGDIWQKKETILKEIIRKLSGEKLDLVFATPPCQGMSKNGRGKLLNGIREGKKSEIDERNLLIIPTVEIFVASGADTLIMENVPEMEKTYIPHPYKHGELINILDFIQESLGKNFVRCIRNIEFADYGVPQCRQRLISIFTKNEKLKSYLQFSGDLFPPPTYSKDGLNLPLWITVRDAISHLPPLCADNPKNAKCQSIPYHYVPLLDEDKYLWVSNTPPEKSAFDNQCINPHCRFTGNQTHQAKKNSHGINRASTETPIYCQKCGHLLPRPWVREGKEYRLMKGYTSAYKRMSWDAPSSTLTRNLSYACSDNKIHPSQHRVLSLYEAMILHTIDKYPFQWKRADGKKISDKLIRDLIGESVPPLGLEQIFSFIMSILTDNHQNVTKSQQKSQQLCLF
ncbi:MAG: DNA cytosine methyltransferase [Cyanobacteria bacterium]|nr:DNA cytosine methyltransferase [Cyanobacteria bacterium CG_2015-16_32_12]NCO78946.1 DNA cytosine methyltransferase [Cyanobacteria bacterium CG_2015-22_32_23]NCQ04967.1 DNA cytosine methyltransferase [Cyanobacteria bacterium CG_2015-09_32_10]NCQ43035.1 DNA cytosine methyltransferase [Cyanobacteria bacterium CG_2015-04_32_10]NCS83819.1 DNA cytosine methyltransferase [Cyanobacteria bacterium CG_2015-02_32_10]